MKKVALYLSLLLVLINCKFIFDKDNIDLVIDTNLSAASEDPFVFEDFANLFVDIDLPIIIDTNHLYLWRDFDEWIPLTLTELHHVKINEVFEKCENLPFQLYDVFPIGKFKISDSIASIILFLKMVDQCPYEAAFERVFLLTYDSTGQQISHFEIASGLHLGATSEWIFCEISTDLMIKQNMYEIFWFADEPEPKKKDSAFFKIKPDGIIKRIDPK